ncbi:MAG TPA: double zinc ribbon domain-containing protein [Gemmatimonadaceae bacterium]|nr:double zinc ribbon domain-containing protein [Gemmatimonadaceae bacterium]
MAGGALNVFLRRSLALARPVGRAALDLLLPPLCPACERLIVGTSEALVCSTCWARVSPLPAPRCERCGHPSDGHICRWCELLPTYVRAARSACWTAAGPALAIVHALKYGRWQGVANGMAERMARLDWPRDVSSERTALVPVPLSAPKLRERGFNQSELLARPLATRWTIPVWTDVLVRARATETQTRLTPEQRRHNVSGAFAAAPAARGRLRRAHVVLVDDVVTTAATLNACAAALFDGGARIISYVTFGRAPAIGDRVP